MRIQKMIAYHKEGDQDFIVIFCYQKFNLVMAKKINDTFQPFELWVQDEGQHIMNICSCNKFQK